MTEVYRYKRGVGRAVTKTPAGDKPPRAGEMIALPGKKHRTYRATVRLDANNKPVRPPLRPASRKVAPVQEDLIELRAKLDRLLRGDTR